MAQKNKIISTHRSKSAPVRIGFDLDGVILYNPIRVIRPIISFCKDIGIIKRRKLEFFRPKNKIQESLWWLVHKTSAFEAPGLEDLRTLVAKENVEVYLITARFNHLKSDFNGWLSKIRAEEIFTECFMNEKNEQPHLFKERMIHKLGLVAFVEDNYDIVSYLTQSKLVKQCKICWVANVFDRKIAFPRKFSGLKQAVAYLRTLL